MELLQFVHGVIDPQFTIDEARLVQEKFGPAFKKVIGRSTRSPASTRRRSKPPSSDFQAAEFRRMGHPEVMKLPPGTVDPMFLHELALELKMPVGEMSSRMSAHELAVSWPFFFAYRERERQREQQKTKQGRGR
jgi:hypothetical protein